jgi:ankyrin repeat protein
MSVENILPANASANEPSSQATESRDDWKLCSSFTRARVDKLWFFGRIPNQLDVLLREDLWVYDQPSDQRLNSALFKLRSSRRVADGYSLLEIYLSDANFNTRPGAVDLLKKLLSVGVDVDYTSLRTGLTPLHVAVNNRTITAEVIETLLACRPRTFNFPNKCNETVLDLAMVSPLL